LDALLNDLQTRGYLTHRSSSGRLICSLAIAGWEYLEQLNASAKMEKPQGAHIHISGGTVQGNIVGNISGDNAGVHYTHNDLAAWRALKPREGATAHDHLNKMPSVTYQQGIQLLQHQIEEGKNILKSRPWREEEYSAWVKTTRSILTQVFPPDSDKDYLFA